jgi:hypothetical protein
MVRKFSTYAILSGFINESYFQATAIRDWEMPVSYSAKAGQNLLLDPFIISSARDLQHDSMEDKGLVQRGGGQGLRTPIDRRFPELPGHARKSFNRARSLNDFLNRCIFALFGGISLIGPMLLMVLHKNILTTLLTVSVSVVIFGCLVAVFSTGTPENVLAAVAAYAAVLVVFVGASS